MKQQLIAQFESQSKYRLLELTPELHNAIKAGGAIKIKGPAVHSHDLVICTPDRTMRMRQMNQSNTLMLVRPDDCSNDVSSTKDGSSHNKGLYIAPGRYHLLD